MCVCVSVLHIESVLMCVRVSILHIESVLMCVCVCVLERQDTQDLDRLWD